MNETRKAIIELIAPYMDRTLGEWCLFMDYLDRICQMISIKDIMVSPWNRTTCDYPVKEVEYRFTDKSLKRRKYEPWYNCQSILGDFPAWWYNELGELLTASERYLWKTIGHYDITAVIKYITANKWDKWCLDKIIYKPLYLYTEEEEKVLLDLLIKLN